MKIGVISDTHGVVPAWEKSLKHFSSCGLIIHAGDILYHPPRKKDTDGYDLAQFAKLLNSSPVPIVMVQGNCDSEVYEELVDFPVQSPYAVVESEGIRIVVNHGHIHNRESMLATAKKYKADIFISGHTHIPVLDKEDGVILLNPGSAAIPKYEVDGKPVPSVAIIKPDKIVIVSIDDGSELMRLKDWKEK